MSYHIFSLPKELLDTLTPRTLAKSPSRASSPPPASISQTFIPSAPSGSKSCNICLGSAFADVDDQRAHFKSDWHRYNVKLRLRGESATTEAHFSSLIEGWYCPCYHLCSIFIQRFVRLGGLPFRLCIFVRRRKR